MDEVVNYLQSYKDYFWQYEDAGKVIAIPDGKTIGYSKLLLSEIVNLLAPQGLPRFGSLLLATVATNPHGLETLDQILKILNIDPDNSGQFEEGIQFARLLTQLPTEYKKGKLRIELLRGIFYNSHNSVNQSKSRNIQAALKQHSEISHYPAVLIKQPIPMMAPYLDFKTLGLIGRELKTIEEVKARLTNLPDLKDTLHEIDFQEQQNKSEEGLIENLIKEQQTFHVGSLVSRLMSGLNIPFHSSLPSEQPLGGVADITNKGTFDKLLISEFAFDDVILMSRLANNESLYKHREVPPSDNNYNRVIILDVSLKNWGVIRTISFASMLAITNHPKNKNPCRVFLVGKSYQEIAFESTDDIVQAMLVMDSSLDPGAGLLKLFTEEKIEVSEIFFIGNQETLKQPVMQLFSAEYGKRIDHWIHPTNEGVITVYKNPKRGKRFIQELKIPLEEAWQQPKKRPKENNNPDFDNPILYPNGGRILSSWVGSDFSYVSTKEKSLFRYYGSKGPNLHSGLKLISKDFSNNYNIKAVMTHEDLTVTVLVGEPKKKFSLFWPETGKKIDLDRSFKFNNPLSFSVQDNCFLCNSRQSCHLIQLDGTITKRESGFKVKKRNPPISYQKQVYRNLNEITITGDGKLRFGKHELVCTNRSLILVNRPSGPITCSAESIGSGMFKFEDGSSIWHNRNGMLVLVSSDIKQPWIYIPCVLNSALGVATENTFAGDRYYRLEPRRELHFEEERFNSIEVVKMTLDIVDLDIQRPKYNVLDNGVVASDDLNGLQELRKKLTNMNIKSTIKHRGLNQKVLKPDVFYHNHIKAFIDQICFHGNSTD